MEQSNRWPASAMVTAAVLAVAAGAGWYDMTAQLGARGAAVQSAQRQRAGLEARIATLAQDLSQANAEARSLAVQATDARAAAADAQHRATVLRQQRAESGAGEQQALAAADRKIAMLTAAGGVRTVAAACGRRPQGVSNITAASARSDIAPALPLPGLPAGATGRDFLVVAQQSIRSGNLAEAQSSLERAEIRFLNDAARTAKNPMRQPDVMRVQHALDQLGANDSHGALATVDHLLSTATAWHGAA